MAASDPGATPTPLADIDPANAIAWPTGLTELDRVLGGGLVSGSVTLLGGEPGIGKSTLLLQVLGALAAAGNRCLLVSAEESAQQVRVRAERLGALAPELWILAETSLPSALAALDSVKPDYLVVDSIQTVFDPDLESAPGSVAHVGTFFWRANSSAASPAASIVTPEAKGRRVPLTYTASHRSAVLAAMRWTAPCWTRTGGPTSAPNAASSPTTRKRIVRAPTLSP